MTSEQAREQFSAAIEQDLDAEQQSAFEAALAADAQLARDYASFRDMLARTRPIAHGERPVPDLLPGVQRKLRERSQGRFYADRFAERLGSGLLQPLTLALILLGLLAVAWFGLSLFEGTAALPSGAHRP
jgi:anti-sigma factor RsiW